MYTRSIAIQAKAAPIPSEDKKVVLLVINCKKAKYRKGKYAKNANSKLECLRTISSPNMCF